MRHTVRIISLIVAICCLLSYVPVNAITIPTTAEPEIVLSSASGEAGNEVTVDISISGNPGVAYLKLKVDYDQTALTLVSASNLSVLAGTFTTSKTTSVKPYVLQWMGAENSENNGTIATVTFKVSEESESGSYAVNAEVCEAYNEDYEDVEIAVQNGNITVSGLVGDINGDGVVNVKDLARMKKILVGNIKDYSFSAVDLNGDGSFNVIDYVRFKRILAVVI